MRPRPRRLDRVFDGGGEKNGWLNVVCDDDERVTTSTMMLVWLVNPLSELC